jgi:PAS domain S-box-containing protein
MTNLILVVDDDELMRMQLRELLEAAGYQVAEAANGKQGLMLYTELQPQMLLLDAMMPGMDGFTCCSQLQTLPGGADTPVLMVTGLYDQESVEHAFAVGATDYITKPVQWSVLRQRVSRILQASRAMRDLRLQTQQAQLREAQLMMALEAARMGIWDWDIINNSVTWSENKELLFGLEKGSFDGSYETFLSIVHPEDRPVVNTAVTQSVQIGTEYDIEFRIVMADGSIRWMTSKGLVFRNHKGEAVRMSGVDMDITKRKQTEEALEAYANRQALVAKLSQMALAGCDLLTLMQETANLIIQALEVEHSQAWELLPDNKLLLRAGVGWHSQSGKLTTSAGTDSHAGYTLLTFEPVVVRDFRRETRFQTSQLLQDNQQDNQIVSGVSVLINGKSHPFGVLVAHSTQERTFGREDVYFLQSVANVLATAMERQNVEEALKESEERWQLAVAGTNDGIWDWNIKTNDVFFSTRWKEMLGYQEYEILNRFSEWINRLHPDDVAEVMRVIQEHFDKKTPFYICEYRLRCKDGSYKWVLARGQALWDETGNAVRMAGSHTDITERKLAEEQLLQSEERFQIVARATNDAVWDWDLASNKIWWNKSVHTLFGYTKEQVQDDARWWSEHLHPYDKQRVINNNRAVIESGEQFWTNEYRFRRADGSYADILDRGYIVHNSEGKAIRMIGAMMDITERKRTQEELRKQNLRFSLFADVTVKIRQSLQIDEILQTSVTEVQKLLIADRVVLFRISPDGAGKIVKESVLPGIEQLFGRTIHDPCFAENYIEKYRQGYISSVYDIEAGGIEECYVEFLQQFGVKANLVVPIIRSNQLWGLLIAHHCTKPRQWDDWETELLRQLADQIGIALAQAKLLEQETRQRQELARSNEELQQFAFVASHDLQEPLRKIKAFGDRLRTSYADVLDEQGRDYLQRMQNAAGRMQILIEDLLTLSRVTTRGQPFTAVNLSLVTQEVLSDLEVRIGQTGARVEVRQLPTINGDPLQIRQLLQNLIGNALKFYRKDETLVIKIYCEFLTNQSDKVLLGTPELCQIFVEDNGIGFDEKYLDRIFNVFQRLHGRSEYEGTGMGLAICRKIVERHQGTITAQSALGQGSKFIVTLPVNPRL